MSLNGVGIRDGEVLSYKLMTWHTIQANAKHEKRGETSHDNGSVAALCPALRGAERGPSGALTWRAGRAVRRCFSC